LAIAPGVLQPAANTPTDMSVGLAGAIAPQNQLVPAAC